MQGGVLEVYPRCRFKYIAFLLFQYRGLVRKISLFQQTKIVFITERSLITQSLCHNRANQKQNTNMKTVVANGKGISF